MASTELSKPPEKVSLAIKLLYLIVAIGVVRAAMTVMQHIDVRSPDFLIVSKILLYAVSLYLIYQLGKGRNWARWSLVAMLVIHVPLTVLPAFESLSIVPVQTIMGFVQLGLYLVALVLLFHSSSSGWFNAGPAARDH